MAIINKLKMILRQKLACKLITRRGSPDKEKYIQLDKVQSVKCFYLCHELKMKRKMSVIYTVTDSFVKKI